MEEGALFVRDGDAYVATNLAQGGWDPGNANGGTVLALVGDRLEDVPSLVPMTMSRMTADLVRPVPLGRRLRIEPRVLREGKKIQVVDLEVVVDELACAHVRVLRLRQSEFDPSDLPRSSTDERPADALEAPEASRSYRGATPHDPGFLHAVDMRYARRRDGGTAGIWIRLEVPVVAGEPVRPAAFLAFGFDFANL
ncbi:MAG: thioesterase family protein, partial [Acidimicrobiales bacterium]|nr:thioesterase family protein [Acidimicrobiales bacterium]